MATSNSNARLVNYPNGVVSQTLAPQVNLTYNPDGTIGVASFQCKNYVQIGNAFHEFGTNIMPKTVVVDLPSRISTCYGMQQNDLVDPVTGADLTKISVAGILSLFQLAFDSEFNVEVINIQVKSANMESSVADFNYSANGMTVQFTTTANTDAYSSWSWIFGDGTYSFDSNTTHVFSASGKHSVSFVLVDATGESYSNTQIIEIST